MSNFAVASAPSPSDDVISNSGTEGEASEEQQQQQQRNEDSVKDEEEKEMDEVELSSSLKHDFFFLQTHVTPSAILSQTPEYISVTIMRTPYARVQLSYIINSGYPDILPGVELSSSTLPFQLLRNKEKECLEKAKAVLQVARSSTGTNTRIGIGLFESVYMHIHTFILKNLFVPAWKEVRQLVTLCSSSSGGVDEDKGKDKDKDKDGSTATSTSTTATTTTSKLIPGQHVFSLDDIKGIITLRLQCGEYIQSLRVTIPLEYPESGIKLEFCNPCTMPQEISLMFQAQAEDIVRRCESGISIDGLLVGTGVTGGPIELLTDINSHEIQSKKAYKTAGIGRPSENIRVRALDSNGIVALKHDIGVLKQISDLKAATIATTGSSKHMYKTAIAQEKKEARKTLRRLAAAEIIADTEEAEKLLHEEQAEAEVKMQTLMKMKCTDIATPSLYATCRFLIQDYVQRLPNELCQACQKSVLPCNPYAPALKVTATVSGEGGGGGERNVKHKNNPMRAFCGHWLHYNCLDIWLTTPPFARLCPAKGCGRRIWHPDWPQDIKILEKAWAKKKEAEREKNDIASMMGF